MLETPLVFCFIFNDADIRRMFASYGRISDQVSAFAPTLRIAVSAGLLCSQLSCDGRIPKLILASIPRRTTGL